MKCPHAGCALAMTHEHINTKPWIKTYKFEALGHQIDIPRLRAILAAVPLVLTFFLTGCASYQRARQNAGYRDMTRLIDDRKGSYYSLGELEAVKDWIQKQRLRALNTDAPYAPL